MVWWLECPDYNPYILTDPGSNPPLSNFRLMNWSGLVLNLTIEGICSDVELESMEEARYYACGVESAKLSPH